jgi:hypothetical protein
VGRVSESKNNRYCGPIGAEWTSAALPQEISEKRYTLFLRA